MLLVLAGCAGAGTAVPPIPSPEPELAVLPETPPPPTILPTAVPPAEATAPPLPPTIPSTAVNPTAEPTAAPSLMPTVPGQNRRVADDTEYSFPQLLPYDGIRPIYDPEFAPAAEAPLDDQELVMGVAWDGEAKAYPVTVLRGREMVNDELAGIPTLVTW